MLIPKTHRPAQPDPCLCARERKDRPSPQSPSPALPARFGVRQIKYLNDIVEQDVLSGGYLVLPMMGFKSFHSAKITLAGIEILAMLKKFQPDCMPLFVRNPVDTFNQLTRKILPQSTALPETKFAQNLEGWALRSVKSQRHRETRKR